MRPRDIEKIANSVVGAFGSPTRASAGCGDISSTELFECIEQFQCTDAEPGGGYECGGAGDFFCLTFHSCEPPGIFECPDNGGQFDCAQLFNPNG